MYGNKPIILGFVSDLLFSTKIESIVEKLGLQIIWFVPNLSGFDADVLTSHNQYAEHVGGSTGRLIDLITRIHPVMILLDLSNNSIPWREWLPLLKSAPATRRIPIVCYGSHKDGSTIQYAQSSGADAVLARSAFMYELPRLIEKYAHFTGTDLYSEVCRETLSAPALQGLEAFNSKHFFEAHELLESAWNADESVGREIYRAILQVAVAYLQIERQNYRGAVKMFLRLRQWIDPLPSICRGIDINQIRADAENVYQSLLILGPDHIADFDRNLFRPIRYSAQ